MWGNLLHKNVIKWSRKTATGVITPQIKGERRESEREREREGERERDRI